MERSWKWLSRKVNKMKKDRDYFMNLNYPIEIQNIEKNEGGGFSASINILGKYAFCGDGETVEEAIRDLDVIKKDLFEKYLKKGISIPEPTKTTPKKYSGKFIIRIPSMLHRHLSEEAKRNNTTLNQYCIYLLSREFYSEKTDNQNDNMKLTHIV